MVYGCGPSQPRTLKWLERDHSTSCLVALTQELIRQSCCEMGAGLSGVEAEQHQMRPLATSRGIIDGLWHLVFAGWGFARVTAASRIWISHQALLWVVVPVVYGGLMLGGNSTMGLQNERLAQSVIAYDATIKISIALLDLPDVNTCPPAFGVVWC